MVTILPKKIRTDDTYITIPQVKTSDKYNKANYKWDPILKKPVYIPTGATFVPGTVSYKVNKTTTTTQTTTVTPKVKKAQPQNQPGATTPLKATTKPKHKIANGTDITGTFVRNTKIPFEINDVIHQQGFDGPPRIVKDKNEFKKLMQESGIIIKRGYSAPTKATLKAYQNELYGENGTNWYVNCSQGGHAFGQGMYSAGTIGTPGQMPRFSQAIDNEVAYYARGGGGGRWNNRVQNQQGKTTESMTLDKSAKIVSYNKLQTEYTQYKNSRTVGTRTRKMTLPDGTVVTDKEASFIHSMFSAGVGKYYAKEIKAIADGTNKKRSNLTQPIAKKLVDSGIVDMIGNVPYDFDIEKAEKDKSYKKEFGITYTEIWKDDKNTGRTYNNKTKKWESQTHPELEKFWNADTYKNAKTELEKKLKEIREHAESVAKQKIKEARKPILALKKQFKYEDNITAVKNAKINDIGSFAAARGYDAFYSHRPTAGLDYVIVVNRTKLIISENRVK